MAVRPFLTSVYKTHTHRGTHRRSLTHALSHTYTPNTHRHMHTHTRIHTHSTHSHLERHKHTHSHTHALTHGLSLTHTLTHMHCVPCLPQGFPWSLFGSSPRRLHTAHGPVSGIRNTLAPKDELYYCCRRIGVSSQETGTHTFLYGEPRNPGSPPSFVRGGMGTCPFL